MSEQKETEDLIGYIMRDKERRAGHRPKVPSRNAERQASTTPAEVEAGQRVAEALSIAWG